MSRAVFGRQHKGEIHKGDEKRREEREKERDRVRKRGREGGREGGREREKEIIHLATHIKRFRKTLRGNCSRTGVDEILK